MVLESDLEEIRNLKFTAIPIKVEINKMSVTIMAVEFEYQQAKRSIRLETFGKIAGKKAIKVDIEELVM